MRPREVIDAVAFYQIGNLVVLVLVKEKKVRLR